MAGGGGGGQGCLLISGEGENWGKLGRYLLCKGHRYPPRYPTLYCISISQISDTFALACALYVLTDSLLYTQLSKVCIAKHVTLERLPRVSEVRLTC